MKPSNDGNQIILTVDTSTTQQNQESLERLRGEYLKTCTEQNRIETDFARLTGLTQSEAAYLLKGTVKQLVKGRRPL